MRFEASTASPFPATPEPQQEGELSGESTLCAEWTIHPPKQRRLFKADWEFERTVTVTQRILENHR